MISFKSLTTNVIWNNSHPSWHGKVWFNIWKDQLWMMIMSSGMCMRFRLKSDYNKSCACMPSDFIGFWVNSLVQWSRNNELHPHFVVVSGRHIGLPNYVFITKGIVAPSGAMTTLDISSVSGSKNASDNGTTKSGGTIWSGGTIGGDGVGASTST